MQQIQFHNIILIGAGNLATNLGMALCKAGHTIIQVYSRTMASAETLAEKLHSQPTTDIEKLASNADIYIVALKDNVIASLLPDLTKGREDRLFVHTAGSMPADIFKPYVKQYGVLYPMQTFSKTRLVSFEHIPCFIEANTPQTLQTIQQLVSSLCDRVIELPSEKRKLLHLAAVFACNFSNLCYHLADKVLATENIPFDVMLPLIDETALKVHDMPPAMAQTGPAIRYDRNVIDKHIEMLANMASVNPNTSPSHQPASLADFYQIASNLIHQLSTTESSLKI